MENRINRLRSQGVAITFAELNAHYKIPDAALDVTAKIEELSKRIFIPKEIADVLRNWDYPPEWSEFNPLRIEEILEEHKNEITELEFLVRNGETRFLNLPVYKIGDRDFRARELCIDISQEELDADDDPLFEYVESYNVQIVPAVQAVQLVVTTDDGTGGHGQQIVFIVNLNSMPCVKDQCNVRSCRPQAKIPNRNSQIALI